MLSYFVVGNRFDVFVCVWGEGEGVLLFCCFGKFQIYIPYLASLCDLVGMVK